MTTEINHEIFNSEIQKEWRQMGTFRIIIIKKPLLSDFCNSFKYVPVCMFPHLSQPAYP